MLLVNLQDGGNNNLINNTMKKIAIVIIIVLVFYPLSKLNFFENSIIFSGILKGIEIALIVLTLKQKDSNNKK
jgi:hypothetical protein